MVFSSVPVYLDPPNWHQQPNQQQPAVSSENNLQLPPPPPPSGGGSGGMGSIRPGSMADRARMAKLPQPEAALKCPRCESTNTKFCYFNNYSLSQPRHFCKTCRRYWTRGGALRNVPVGGGCRRNKRNKSSRSKSPVAADNNSGSTSTSTIPSNSCTADIFTHLPQPPPQLPFLPSLHHLSDYGISGCDIGLNFGGIQPPMTAAGGSGGSMLSAGLAEHWRMPQVHQFPFLAGLEPPAGLYQLEGQAAEPPNYLRSKPLDGGVAQLATTSVKMEDNKGLDLSRDFSGVPGNDHQYNWGGNTWTDLSGFASSSSTSHLL